jgi:hypothetical protein
VDSAKQSLKETGAKDISSSGEAGSSSKTAAHATYGDLSTSDPIRDRRLEEERLDERVPEDVVVTTNRPR